MLFSIVMMILWIVVFLWVADSDIENMRKRGDYPFDLEKRESSGRINNKRENKENNF